MRAYRGRKHRACGASWQKGRPAGALGTLEPLCELTPLCVPGHEAGALVGTVHTEASPVPWARLGSDLVGELPGPFGLEAGQVFLSLPFHWKPLVFVSKTNYLHARD